MEKFVRLTKKKVEEIFDDCNQKYFNNEVERPIVFELWTPSKHIAGMVRPIYIKSKKLSSALHISNNFNWREEDLIEVILHEMIHLYIKDYIKPKRWWHILFPPKQHNKKYKEIMNELNNKFGLNIKLKATQMQHYMK